MSKNNKICRACLLDSGDMRSLFATGSIMGQTAKLVEVLLACADLKITKDDGLPQQICMKCIHQVSRAFSFKLQCEKNQQLLLERLADPTCKPYSEIDCNNLTPEIELNEANQENSIDVDYVEEVLVEIPPIVINQKISSSIVAEKTISLPKTTANKSIHENNKHKCKSCGKLFSMLSALKLHNFKEHQVLKPKCPKCDICGKSCRSEEQLKRHINIHKTGKPFPCELCDKSFRQRAAYIAHTYSHTGERPFLCTECGKAFKQNSELKIHMRMHLDLRPYSCNICGKAYRNSSLFSIHKRVHSGERPFACTYCDKRFISSSCLKNHIMIHTGEKPYTCDYCGRSFNRSNALNIHRKIHTGERPHVCSVCGKGFIQAHCLQSHMNTHKTTNS